MRLRKCPLPPHLLSSAPKHTLYSALAIEVTLTKTTIPNSTNIFPLDALRRQHIRTTERGEERSYLWVMWSPVLICHHRTQVNAGFSSQLWLTAIGKGGGVIVGWEKYGGAEREESRRKIRRQKTEKKGEGVEDNKAEGEAVVDREEEGKKERMEGAQKKSGTIWR